MAKNGDSPEKEVLAKSGYKQDIKYKSLIKLFYIYGYTLKTK
jgi:hypothetical protein